MVNSVTDAWILIKYPNVNIPGIDRGHSHANWNNSTKEGM